MTLIECFLGATRANYHPCLTEVINDSEAATRLMNDQLQLGLAIGGLLLLMRLAPLVI